MVMAKKSGLMDPTFKEIGKTAKCTALVSSHGVMVEGTKECTMRTEKMATVSSLGQINASMKVSGATEECTDLGYTLQARAQ